MHWSQLFQFQASHQNAGQIFWVAIRGFSGCLLESLTAHNTSGVVNEQRLVVGRLAKNPAIAPSLSCQAPDAPPLKTGHRTNGPPTLGQMEPIWSVARWVFFFFFFLQGRTCWDTPFSPVSLFSAGFLMDCARGEDPASGGAVWQRSGLELGQIWPRDGILYAQTSCDWFDPRNEWVRHIKWRVWNDMSGQRREVWRKFSHLSQEMNPNVYPNPKLWALKGFKGTYHTFELISIKSLRVQSLER